MKNLIDCYNPIIREATDVMKGHMLDMCKNWENKEEILNDAIRCVWPEIDIEYAELELDKIDQLEKLIDTLLMAIEAIMPKQCKECDEHYYVGTEHKPTIRCMWCKAGAHDCIDRGNKGKLKGMDWLCKICKDIIQNQIICKIDIEKRMELIKKETAINFEGFNKPKKNKGKEEDVIEVTDDEIIFHDETAQKDNDTEMPQQQLDEGNGSNRPTQNQQENSGGRNTEVEGPKDDNKKRDQGRNECHFWKNYQCKFGEKCRMEHPTRCQEILEKGTCSNGNNCKLAHPKICWNIYKHQHCARKHCWYIHPSKITNKFVSGNKTSNKTHQPGSQWKPGNGYQQGPNKNQSNNNNCNGQNNNGNQQGGWERNWNPGYDNPMYGHQTPNMAPFLGWGPTPSEAYKGGEEPPRIKLMRMFQEMQSMMMKL